MALRKEKIEGFRQELFARRESMAQELRQATAYFINDDTTYQDTIDQASADIDRSFALQMKSRERDILWQIDAALKRIETDTFGTCERCDESISEARIKAFPFTTLCIDCKAELESEEQRFPGRSAS
jgi:DnaK suppressor protein